jgi:hypothetical protein
MLVASPIFQKRGVHGPQQMVQTTKLRARPGGNDDATRDVVNRHNSGLLLAENHLVVAPGGEVYRARSLDSQSTILLLPDTEILSGLLCRTPHCGLSHLVLRSRISFEVRLVEKFMCIASHKTDLLIKVPHFMPDSVLCHVKRG